MTFAEQHMVEVAARWREALDRYQQNPALESTVRSFVDAFFARNAGLERTPVTERFITALAIDRAASLSPEQLLEQPKAA